MKKKKRNKNKTEEVIQEYFPFASRKKNKKENYCLQHMPSTHFVAEVPGFGPVGNSAGKEPSLGCGWDEV